MTDADYSRRLKKLAKILQQHFDAISSKEARKRADDLLRNMNISGAFEKIEKSNLNPADDREHIRLAAKALSSAQNHLSQVGLHGQKTFAVVLEPFLDESDYSFLVNSGTLHMAKDELIKRVQSLADGLADAIEHVDLEGAPVTIAFGEEPELKKFKASKPQKAVARFFALKCAKIYYDMTGEKPTVSTNPHSYGNVAYGPFLDLVTDAFKAADTFASAELWARQACKDFSPES